MAWTTTMVAITTALVLGCAALVGAQDFTVHMRGEDGGTATIYVSRSAVRDISTIPVDTDTIYRLDQNRRITLDNKNKTYSEITLAELRDAMARRGGPDPQQVEMMRKLGLDAAPAITKLGPGETIAGYATEKYAIKSAMMQSEWSVTTALQYPQAYYEFLAAFLPPGMPDATGLRAVVEIGKIAKGFALKRVGSINMPMSKPITISLVASSVDKAPIPTSTFEVPAGYQRRKTPGR
jgi:hypothetical protein